MLRQEFSFFFLFSTALESVVNAWCLLRQRHCWMVAEDQALGWHWDVEEE